LDAFGSCNTDLNHDLYIRTWPVVPGACFPDASIDRHQVQI